MKTTELNFGMHKKINGMIAIGMKKSEMIEICKRQYIKEHGSAKDWNPRMASKNEFLRSIKSIEIMRAAQKPFYDWAKSQVHPIKKFEKVTREDLCKYLFDRKEVTSSDGLKIERSAWVISRDLHFANKVFSHLTKDNPITKKELGLKSRLQSQVVRGRGNNGIPSDRPGLAEKYKDQITFSRGAGARRESITHVTYDRFRFNKKGMPTQVFLKEKGGRERWAYILPEYQEAIKTIIIPHKGSKKPLFNKYDCHINNHHFRHEYALELLKQLKKEHKDGKPYFEGDAKPEFRLTKKERAMKTWRGIDVKVCGLVSQMLGHNRIQILKSYIW